MQGQPFVHKGKTLLSGIDPVRRAEKAADAVSIKDRTLFLCPSPIFGYGLIRLLERIKTESSSCAVLCVEVEPELYDLAVNNIDSSITSDKMFRLTDICDKTQLAVFVKETWGARAFSRVEMIKFTGGYQIFSQVYDSLCDTLRREIAIDWSNALTLTKLGRLYIRNAVRNLKLVSQFPSISQLSFGEAPVLVLGAGPSLDETLDALNSVKDRYFKIVCVDTCLGALKDRGIVPDLVIILESQHWNLKDFIGCKGWKVPVAIDISSLPASAYLLAENGYLFFTPWTTLNIFERLNKAGLLPASVPPLGSVGLTAVELARRLTSGKIICAGLDFSFTADKFHARSTPGHKTHLNLQTRFRRIFNKTAYDSASLAAVSKSGFSVHSNPALKNYRALFEQEFSGDSRVFDIEGTGLPLGVKTLAMEEAMDILKMNTEDFTRGHGVCGERREEFKLPSFPTPASSASLRLRENSSGIISFIEDEKKLLEELRGILSGEVQASKERLSELIAECDYLWAHFPDYAGGSQTISANANDVSFLKRLRTEIDPMLKLF